jgi:hypothetical protein
MNTNHITRRSTLRSASLAACLALLIAGATACGDEHAAAPTKSKGAASLSSIDLIEQAKANQSAYLRELDAKAAEQARAERADAARWAQGNTTHASGDDHRQPIPSAQHAPGYNKALAGER